MAFKKHAESIILTLADDPIPHPTGKLLLIKLILTKYLLSFY